MKVFKCWIIAFTLSLSTISAGAVDTAHKLNIDAEEFRLDNGMLFLVVERPTVPQIACRLAIRAGSALEEAGKTGIAHLLEHMMFKGTKNFGSLDPEKDRQLQEAIDGLPVPLHPGAARYYEEQGLTIPDHLKPM